MENTEERRFGEETQFKKGNPGGPGRGNKKEPISDPWAPQQGRTSKETLDLNANDFLAFCFRQARKGNNFIAATLINKIVPNGAVALGGKKGLPDFEKLSDAELERIAMDADAFRSDSDGDF